MKFLIPFIMLLSACSDPCRDSTTVLQSSWTGGQQYTCANPNHTMKAERVGLGGGSIKVTCTCPRN